MVAGLVRVLPLFLSPGVPSRLAPVLARGILAVSLETALFVAPPIGWALAASRLVDRGEARALFAVGARPLAIVAAGWPAALGVALAAALAASAWGREASAPGRVFRDLLAEGRAACTTSATGAAPVVVDLPLLGLSWICTGGRAPRIVGPAPVGSGAFAASALVVSDDLRALDASDLEILLSPAEGRPEARIRAAAASIHGLTPLGRASNLSVAGRAFLVAASATVLAALAGGLALVGSIRSRPAAFALGVVGPLAALLVFSALERGPAPGIAYLAVPAAGLAALLVAAKGASTFAARRRTLPA